MEKTVFKSVSDERLVIDVLAPGYDSSMISVSSAYVNGGETFLLKIKGNYKPRKNADGKDVPALAYDKHIEPIDYVFGGDEPLFKGKLTPFNVKDYDILNISWEVRNGIIRISIPKTDLAKGKVIKASNSDANSTGVNA